MRVLIIPDVHLKPWMFRRAAELIENGEADRTVCLMDIADDWKMQFNLDLYIQTYDEAIRYAKRFPDTLWCYGNHDLCYPWNQRETGYSKMAPWTVCEKLRALRESLPDEGQIAYVHKIDSVLFSHGGLADEFVREHVPEQEYENPENVVKAVNKLGCNEIWTDFSPIWLRPQYGRIKLYMAEKLFQVAGHTPVRDIYRKDNLLSCDVFSTDSTGEPIGTREFPVLDTETWEFKRLT